MAKIISNGQELVLSSGGLADVSVDTTLTKAEDGTLGVTTPVKAILTREAFNALSEDERNTGMYVVYDEEDEGESSSGESNASGSSGEVYSTEETRIGTWIDGKPLYRKTFQFTLPSGLTGAAAPVLISSWDSGMDTLVNGYGTVKSSGFQNIPIPYYAAPTDFLAICYNPANAASSPNTIRCVGTSNYDSRQVVYTFEYTKTTDAAS